VAPGVKTLLTSLTVVVTLAAPALTFAQGAIPGRDENETLRKIGDVLHIALPATAGATTVIKRDWDGAIQFGTVFGATVGTFSAAKAAIGKDRPDASDARSFPSGHTAMSFAGSTFMLRRYGKKVGIPLMFTAGFVGFTRVKGQKHYADDVVAGAGLGVLYNLAFTSPYPKRVFLKPVTFSSGGAGVQVQADVGPNPHAPNELAELKEKRFRIEFEYAALYAHSLEGQSPPETGTPIAIAENERAWSPTARFTANWLFRIPHELSVFWAPYEGRDFETISDAPFSFGGVDFEEGEETISRFRYDEIAARYRYRLVNNKRVDFRAGAAVSFRETRGTVLQEEPDLYAEVVDYEVLPLAHLHLKLHLLENVSLIGEADGIATADDRYSLSTLLGVRWDLNQRWGFTFGYRGLWRKYIDDRLRVGTRFDYLTAGIGYAF
jgi:hypothetical protein